MSKLWKLSVKDKNYGIRGHKLYCVLLFVFVKGNVSYKELNKFAYNYTRRANGDVKFDSIKNRGYIGMNLYGGYIGRHLEKTSRGNYTLNTLGVNRLATDYCRFGIDLLGKFIKNR